MLDDLSVLGKDYTAYKKQNLSPVKADIKEFDAEYKKVQAQIKDDNQENFNKTFIEAANKFASKISTCVEKD